MEIEKLEHEYTAICSPPEMEMALDVIGAHLASSKKGRMLITDDEMLGYKIQNRSSGEIEISKTPKENLSGFGTVILAFKKLDTGEVNRICESLDSGTTLLVLSQVLIDYDMTHGPRIVDVKNILKNIFFTFKIQKVMEKNGVSITGNYGFHTPKSILLGRLHQLAMRLGLDLFADRIYFKRFKENMLTESFMRHFSALVLMIGGKD